MNLLKKLAPLCQGGMTFTFKVTGTKAGLIQLDILPIGQIESTGAGLPAQALVGTADEIDAGLEQFLDTFLASVSEVNSVFANAEKQVAEQARIAKEAAASKVKTTGKGKPSPSLIPSDDLDDDGGDTEGSGLSGEVKPVDQLSTALPPGLFTMVAP